MDSKEWYVTKPIMIPANEKKMNRKEYFLCVYFGRRRPHHRRTCSDVFRYYPCNNIFTVPFFTWFAFFF